MLDYDCRNWFYFPTLMPIDIDGAGPANIQDAAKITFEVWDQELTQHSSHDFLCDAINEAMRLERKRLLSQIGTGLEEQ